ncbi:MAG: alkaline phosphatase D family protein [Weeksellaceae bacterium]
MKINIIGTLCIGLAIFSCNKKVVESKTANQINMADSINIDENKSFKIAFGSCAEEDKPQPLLDVATNLQPNLFIYLGDNIYGDTYSMDTLEKKYEMLANKPEFKRLKATTPILATWDDHDFGWNDAGRHYPHKKDSKEIFMDFWEVPQDSERRKHEGIYGVEHVDFEGFNIQIIILDTRTFRDDLTLNDKSDPAYKNDYRPNISTDSTFLGATQWSWLDSVLKEDADLRIVVSSNQFSHEYNGWESWTNVPHEQQRFINLIAKNKADGIIFLSGDVHWGELSKRNTTNTYPLYDATSSGITETWPHTEPNKYRIGDVIPQNNIGLLEIFPKKKDAEIVISLYDITNKPVVQHKIKKSEISF